MQPNSRPRALVTRIVLLALCALLVTNTHAQGLTNTDVVQQERTRGIVELHEALTPLRSVASFMTAGAHPDDERSSLLALLARGHGVRTITVTANRGEGGQNSIGTDYGQALGVLRSREMEESSRAFNVELFFLSESFDDPIYDFSFSKSALETLDVWGEDAVMERLVRAIRQSRPDVLFTNFQDVFGQHGHHRAMTLATERAYEMAGDPTVFPEHLEQGLEPWAPRKLFLPAGRGSGLATEELPTTHRVEIGAYDQIFGASYVQLGEQSRAYHRSQDMGRWFNEGPQGFNLYLVDSRVTDAQADADIFDGIPNTVADLAGLTTDETLRAHLLRADAAIQDALDAYPSFSDVHAAVTEALVAVRDARAAVTGHDDVATDIDFRLADKEAELQHAGRVALSLVPRLSVSNTELVRGGSTEITLTAFLGGETPIEDVELDLVTPDGWTVEREVADEDTNALELNQTASATFLVTVPDDAELFNPYRRNTHPFRANTELNGVVRYTVDGVPFEVAIDPSVPVAVLPDLSLRVSPENLVHNLLDADAAISVDVAATNYTDGAVTSTLQVVAPAGWTVEPASADVSFNRKGDTRGVTFTLLPPEGLERGSYDFTVEAHGSATSAEYVRVIEYDHIGRTYMVLPARANLQAFDVAFDDGIRVGWIDGGSDLTFEGLRRIGIPVDLLTEGDLATGDLDAYDTIVVGMYAYRTRADLVAANDRLMEWVERGGNLVVTYHRPFDNWDANDTPPYYLQFGTVSLLSRVTDPAAPVAFLAPEHPILTTPNAITDADFDGWIKERGLYFPSDWDERYTELFSITDRQWADTEPETPFTGPMLTVDIGEGRYTYTSLVLHTQIDENVPGAYRLWANLVTPPTAADASASR